MHIHIYHILCVSYCTTHAHMLVYLYAYPSFMYVAIFWPIRSSHTPLDLLAPQVYTKDLDEGASDLQVWLWL